MSVSNYRYNVDFTMSCMSLLVDFDFMNCFVRYFCAMYFLCIDANLVCSKICRQFEGKPPIYPIFYFGDWGKKRAQT